MSDFTAAYSPSRAAERSLLPSLAFLGLLLLVFVGLDAFSPPPLVAQFGGVQEASRGDVVRQIAYLGVAGLIALAALTRFGQAALRIVPVSMLLLLAWCLASAWRRPLRIRAGSEAWSCCVR